MNALHRVFETEFYARPTLSVARDLLGTTLCRRLPDGQLLTGKIVEVEAYTEDDPACHAFRGLTPRTAVMFGPPGRAYVYFIYGMYWCLNVVTEPEGKPGAVLIRAVEGEGTNGPGKLCRQWQIAREENGIDLSDPSQNLWISKSPRIPDSEVVITPRVGLSVAHERMWRFHLRDHRSVSKGSTSPRKSRKLRK